MFFFSYMIQVLQLLQVAFFEFKVDKFWYLIFHKFAKFIQAKDLLKIMLIFILMIEKFDENRKPLHYMFIGFHCIRFFFSMIFFPKMVQSLQISNVVILLIIADDDILIFLIHHQAKQLDNNYDYCCHLSLLLFPLYIIYSEQLMN